MADVDSKVASIRQAVYGEQVREALASGIEVINNEVTTTTEKQGLLETIFENLIINAGNSNAEIVAARGAEATLQARLNASDAQLAQTETDLNKIGVDIKTKYGAIGDGVLRSIADVFPNTTLSEVQALNSLATLDNSADWYAIQKAIDNELSISIPVGEYITDLPIDVNKRVYMKGKGRLSNIFNKGIGHGLIVSISRTFLSDFQVRGTKQNGSGMFVKKGGNFNNIRFVLNGRYGVEFSNTDHVITFISKNILCDYNVLGGIYLKSDGNHQKNHVVFDSPYIAKNGTSADTPLESATITNGHGIYISGGIGISVNDAVLEYNTGAGLYIDKANYIDDPSNNYLLRGFTGKNIYYEQNKYTHLVVDSRQGVFRNIEIKGSSYQNPFTYPANSIQPTEGDVKIFESSFSKLLGFNVDDKFGGVAQKLEALETSKITNDLESFKTVVLQNGWTGSLLYTKNKLNQVFLQVNIAPGTRTAGTVIGVLNVGYRPRGATFPLIVYSSVSLEAYIGFIVHTSGEIRINNPASTVLPNVACSFTCLFQSTV